MLVSQEHKTMSAKRGLIYLEGARTEFKLKDLRPTVHLGTRSPYSLGKSLPYIIGNRPSLSRGIK